MAPPADLLHTMKGTSFGGIPVAQHWVDFLVWETILNEHEDDGLKWIVELGTWTGGFSFWLDAQARARGMYFNTYDAVSPSSAGGPDDDRRVPGFRQVDVFAWADRLRLTLQVDDPGVLFCDNGNKPRELREFALAMPSGSLVAVHDWGTESGPGDVPDGLVAIHEGFLDEMQSITRWFLRP